MIDNRAIKCACDNPKCNCGISFDKENERLMILRFHDKHGNEHGMRLNRKMIDELVANLKSYKRELKK